MSRAVIILFALAFAFVLIVDACSTDLEPPYDKLTYCNKGDDDGEEYCKEQTDNEFNHCWNLRNCLIHGEEHETCKGVCIPKEVPCESNDDCKDIGDIDVSGSISASCDNNVCKYSRDIVIT